VLVNIEKDFLRKDLRILAILLTLLLLNICINHVACDEPEKASLFLAPPIHIAEEVGETFDFTVSVSNVEDLYSVGFYAIYNSSILDVSQVIQGPFFPLPPNSHFEFEKNELLGFVRINISSSTPRSGNGTLAWLRFKVVAEAKPGFSSSLDLQHTTLFNHYLIPIIHDLLGAVYFWKYAGSTPVELGRSLDLFTQKGGVGPDTPGGEFVIGVEVAMISRVTYNNDPVQHKLVNFVLRNPLGQNMGFRSSMTDQNGLTIVKVGIPEVSSSYGTWTAISVVDIAEKTVWDTLSFQVIPKIPVGGYTFSIKRYTADKCLALYITVVTMLAAVFTFIRPNKFHRSSIKS
jgi:hypothetical protein